MQNLVDGALREYIVELRQTGRLSVMDLQPGSSRLAAIRGECHQRLRKDAINSAKWTRVYEEDKARNLDLVGIYSNLARVLQHNQHPLFYKGLVYHLKEWALYNRVLGSGDVDGALERVVEYLEHPDMGSDHYNDHLLELVGLWLDRGTPADRAIMWEFLGAATKGK